LVCILANFHRNTHTTSKQQRIPTPIAVRGLAAHDSRRLRALTKASLIILLKKLLLAIVILSQV